MATNNTNEVNDDRSLTKKDLILIYITTFFSVVYLVWRIFFTIPFEYGAVSIVSGIALLVVEALGLVESSVHYYNMCDVKKLPVPTIPIDSYPDVDIFISTYNEPAEVLIKTINGCKHLKYPDKNKVHIYMCDDGHRAEMKELAGKLNINYLDRDNHDGAKAGNLNHALDNTSSPYIVTFDADMIPRSNFLLRTIPYFIDMELSNRNKPYDKQTHLGMVQAPQAFYNPDLFQYYLYSEQRIPNEQDYFYRDIQVSRNKSNCVIYGGSNTVLSRKALRDIGGFYTETITEDYATGMLIQKKGYICYATDEVLASGLSATDLKSLINQRIRWARGVITTNRKMHTYSSRDLTFAQKINYWASVWYWYAPLKRLIYYVCPILYGAFGFMVIKCTLWQILIFWLPMYITSNITLKVISHNLRTAKWTGIYETILFPFLLVPVLLETVGIKMTKFKVTKKGKVENEKGKNLIYIVPFAFLVVLSVIGIYKCIAEMFVSNDLGPLIVLFWLVSNMYTLLMSMFFVLGRDYLRSYDRMNIVMPAVLRAHDAFYKCETVDLSDDGIALSVERPINIDKNTPCFVKLENEEYSCILKCVLVYVDDIRKDNECNWKYAFRVENYCNTYEDYMQLIYDRVPPLPQSLDQRTGIFDDLKINVVKRFENTRYQKRGRSRIELGTAVCDINGNKQRMLDFNYKYCCLKASKTLTDTEILALNPKEGLFLTLIKVKNVNQGNVLYRVENYYDLTFDAKKNSALEEWVASEWSKVEDKEKEACEAGKDNQSKFASEGFNEMDYIIR